MLGKALGLLRRGGGPLARARREEAAGRLAEAVALYMEAGARDDAARLFETRADAAFDPQERYQLLGQALAVAEGERRQAALVKRGELALDLLRSGALRLTSRELGALAAQLGAAGAHTLAAEVYALAGDVEGQARMLVEAGAVERLEQVLSAEQERERGVREREELHRRVVDLDACGRRRDALELARSALGDERLATLARELEARRALMGRARLVIRGNPTEVAFGERVVIGRADAEIVVSSPSISRRHLEIRRTARGPEVEDLGSRNGTFLHGARLDAPLLVGDGLSLELGGDLPARFRRLAEGGVAVELGERRITAPLGALELGHARLEPAADGWLELRCEHAVLLGRLRADPHIQLCVGDRIVDGGSAEPLIEVAE